MTLLVSAALSTSMEERVDAIYSSALLEHPEFAELKPARLKSFIATELVRIAGFEKIGADPLKVSRFDAEMIGAIKVHSGVGSFDEPHKDEDNPRLRDIPWLAWADRMRLIHAFKLALKIAEMRSGVILAKNKAGLAADVDMAKQLIRVYGPNLIYTGYPVETETLERVMRDPSRGDVPFPIENAYIVHGTPRNTVEGAQQFQLPEGSLRPGTTVAHVSHAPHLARILHILGKNPYLPAGSTLFMSPVATSADGRDEFALMEIRGMMYYVFLQQSAAERPHSYQTFAA